MFKLRKFSTRIFWPLLEVREKELFTGTAAKMEEIGATKL